MKTERVLCGCALTALALLSPRTARAQEAPPTGAAAATPVASPPSPPTWPASPTPTTAAPAPDAKADANAGAKPGATNTSPQKGSFKWGPRALEEGQHFTVDPVADGVLIGGGAAVSGLLSLILSTGEIRATPPGPSSSLLSIDRLAVTQHIDPNADLYSTIGLGAAIGYAFIDPLLSAYRDGWDAALVDAVLYAETAALTETLTDVTKIAVRRPRPVDYVNCPYNTKTSSTSSACTGNTDLQLSFFSGHSSTVGALGATATYLAFERAGVHAWRPWVTLVGSVGLETFVSIERVRSGAHFPTDVVAGSFAGAMVGVLVPHLHRHVQEAPPVWIGYSPVNGGGLLDVTGKF